MAIFHGETVFTGLRGAGANFDNSPAGDNLVSGRRLFGKGVLWQSWWARGPRASTLVDWTVRWLNPRTSSPGNLPGCGIFPVDLFVQLGKVSQPSRQIYDFGVLAPLWCGACLLHATSSNLSLLPLTPATSLPLRSFRTV